jgi:hypothetical protein
MALIIEICKELCRSLLVACQQSVATRSVAVGVAVLIAANLGWWALGFLGASGHTGRFQVHEVRGSVAYVDGSVVPADMMLVRLFPEASRGGESNTAMPVTARVDARTGRFQAKWVGGKEEDGSPSLMWRVVVLSGDQKPLAEEVVPREYGSAEQTPVVVAMNGSPLQIRLRRPTEKVRRGVAGKPMEGAASPP